jgi:hypothetical protein
VDPFLLSSVGTRSMQFHNVTVNEKKNSYTSPPPLLCHPPLSPVFFSLSTATVTYGQRLSPDGLWPFSALLFFVLVIFESCSNSFLHLLRGLSLVIVSSTFGCGCVLWLQQPQNLYDIHLMLYVYC